MIFEDFGPDGRARKVTQFADEMERTSQFWGRISGYPSETRTAEWFAGELRKAGVRDVEVQTVDGTTPFWRPRTWEVRVLADPAYGAGSQDVVLASAMPTAGSSIPAPMTAPLVYAGEAGDPVRVDVRGKIAIQHSRPTTGAYSDRTKIRTSQQALQEAGAVAVFNWIEQAGNMHVFDFSAMGGKPSFNLGGADGTFLKAVLEKAPAGVLKARLTLDSDTATGLKAHNVIGFIRGESDEAVVVNAHLDSWFDGAGDNADGLTKAWDAYRASKLPYLRHEADKEKNRVRDAMRAEASRGPLWVQAQPELIRTRSRSPQAPSTFRRK